MKKSKNLFQISTGFTLMELLVVIFIIGILVSIALVGHAGAQRQARDTQRRSDLGQYRNSLEAYAASNNGSYPAASGDTDLSGTFCTSNLSSNNLISECITDPLAGTTGYGYHYRVNSNQSEYVIYALLETSGYWVICSGGQSSKETTAPTSSSCP